MAKGSIGKGQAMHLVKTRKPLTKAEKRGIAKRRAKRKARVQHAIPTILELHDTGHSVQQISNRVRLTPFSICVILERAGRQQ